MNRYPLTAGVVCLCILPVACGSSSDATAPTSGGIVIVNFQYTGTLTVKTGQQVTVTNNDTTNHTLTDQATLDSERSASQTPGGQTPGGTTPGGQTPGGQTPGGTTPGGQTAQFSTGTLDPSGGTRSFTAPAAPGSYPFGCRVHPTMHGTLTVQAGT
jgi:plastocyanin